MGKDNPHRVLTHPTLTELHHRDRLMHPPLADRDSAPIESKRDDAVLSCSLRSPTPGVPTPGPSQEGSCSLGLRNYCFAQEAFRAAQTFTDGAYAKP